MKTLETGQMHGMGKTDPMMRAILFSLALHGAIASILWMPVAQHSISHRNRIIEVTLTDWPQETSAGMPNRVRPSRSSHPAPRPQPHLEIPKTAQPPAMQESPPATENRSDPLPIQTVSISLPGPDSSDEGLASRSQTGPSLTPPRFDAAYRHNPKPDYPALARKLGLQGTVVFRVLIGVEGRPNEIRVEKSSGHAVLDEAARTAVKQWLFEPAREGDLRVAGWVDVPIQFRLE